MSAGTHRDELLKHRLDSFTRMLHGVDEGDVRALHRTRVASRRLRELLPVLELDAATARKLGRRLKAVTAELGPVRELDVIMALLDELHDSGRFSREAIARVSAVLAARRAAARDRLKIDMPAAELHRTAARLERLLDDLGSRERATQPKGSRNWHWALEARVARRRETLNRAMAAAGSVYLPERLHAVRIAVKKLRYALELANEAGLGTRTLEIAALKRMQGLLGRMHDRQVLMQCIREVQARRDVDPASEHDLDAVLVEMEDECRRLHARYVRSRDGLVRVALRPRARRAESARTARQHVG